MEELGKMLVCDRCGKQVFLQHIDTKVRDGGFTIVEKYEHKPEGWTYSRDLNRDLCPDCSAKYEQLVFEFMEEGKVCQDSK